MVLILSCDPCRYDDINSIPEGDIYFNALPVNTNEPSIFQIDLNQFNPREIIKMVDCIRHHLATRNWFSSATIQLARKTLSFRILMVPTRE